MAVEHSLFPRPEASPSSTVIVRSASEWRLGGGAKLTRKEGAASSADDARCSQSEGVLDLDVSRLLPGLLPLPEPSTLTALPLLSVPVDDSDSALLQKDSPLEPAWSSMLVTVEVCRSNSSPFSPGVDSLERDALMIMSRRNAIMTAERRTRWCASGKRFTISIRASCPSE
eukprot:539252-Prymnesium_polylepis.1